ncbi:MAG: Flagellar basal-body rod protein FlgG [Phycisphaerae bacterium]|nr:Flagellar basal-body rod protein FlgG [Phycisphaerae bacterium]
MIYGLWNSAAGMQANLYRQNVMANNLANIDTVGFKQDLAMLMERPVESREEGTAPGPINRFFDRLTGGANVKPTIHNFAAGPVMPTGQPLDAMINGAGFFQVQTANGVRYSRDGRFTINGNGELVTVTGGHPVLSAGGAPITVPDGGQVIINAQGQLLQNETLVGQVGLVEFADTNKLRKIGGNLFIATEKATPQPAANPTLIPGAVEGSNFEPISGLVGMIEATRAFQMNASLLQLQDQTLGRAISDIARF